MFNKTAWVGNTNLQFISKSFETLHNTDTYLWLSILFVSLLLGIGLTLNFSQQSEK